MNYPMAYAVADWLSIGHMRGDAGSLASRLTEVYSHDLLTDLSQLNLMSSHDTERLVSLMQNDHQRGFDNGSHPWQDQDTYDRDSFSEDALVRALIAYSVMVANPGAVMVYNGDEFAMTGADDPDNRRPIPDRYWEMDLDSSGGLEELRLWYRDQVQWILYLRQQPEIGPILRYGDASWEASSDARGLRVIREYEGKQVVVDIGQCAARWSEFSSYPAATGLRRRFDIGASCWEINLRLFTHK
jgi:hypothetical protein